MTDKLVLMMAGGGAAGKTTTTKAFVTGDPEEHQEIMEVPTRKGIEEDKVNWTLYDNCAAVGNYHSGTDANRGPGAVRAAFFECLKVRDVVIVDGMVSTPKWVLMINEVSEQYDIQALCIHFNFPAEELLTRLAGRRGVDKESIRESMWNKKVGLVRRAEILVEHFETKCEVEWQYLEILPEDSPDYIVELLDDAVCDILGGCGD